MENIKEKLDYANVRNCACFNLRKTSRAITQHYDRLLQPSGLRVTQFTILAVIAKAKSITITRMAKQLVMDRTTLTRNLRPLEKQGFIEIIPGDDLRTRYITLLKKGENALANALPLWERAQQRFEEGLGKVNFQSLLSDLSETREIAQNV